MPELQFPHSSSSSSVAPATHPPVDVQTPQVSQAPHTHASVQSLTLAFSSPQTPHPVASFSTPPIEHSPSAAQTSASHSQFSRQVRRNLPQLPQAPRSSLAPALQAPSPVQPPSFCHVPSGPQVCDCVPQFPQLTLRTSPDAQLQSVGASQACHAPITQRSTPVAHSPEQLRCAVAPTSGSVSSQSLPTTMPSPSPSSSGETHIPSMQILPSGQEPGVQAPDPPPAPPPPVPLPPTVPLALPLVPLGSISRSSRPLRR
jgi:hypothetical protein